MRRFSVATAARQARQAWAAHLQVVQLASQSRAVYTAAAADDAPGWLRNNRAAVLTGVGKLEFLDWPLPATPPHGHARIAMRAVGICGSDVHYLQHGKIADFVVRAPLVLGHEASGEVVQLGGGVTELRVGARVTLEPGVPCWHSHLSREGRYNLDPDIVFAATPPHHGSLMQYADHPADWCFALPDVVSFEQGAFCEPLSVGIHAVRRGRIAPGLRVAVLGAGPIGLVTLMSARVFGADKVVVSDLSQHKLDVAAAQGAHSTVLVGRGDQPANTAAQLREALQGDPDVVIDCCGFESSMQTALLACARGGRVVLVGMGAPEMKLALCAAAAKEVDILGSFRYANTFPLALSLLASKRIDVLPLITHRFGWTAAQLHEGFDAAKNADKQNAIKVMFRNLGGRA